MTIASSRVSTRIRNPDAENAAGSGDMALPLGSRALAAAPDARANASVFYPNAATAQARLLGVCRYALVVDQAVCACASLPENLRNPLPLDPPAYAAPHRSGNRPG